MNALRLLLPLTLFIASLGLHAPASLLAHGAMMDYSLSTGVVIQAKYDTGAPMSEAQITVYAPDNPAKPWLAGISDEQGRFSFVPDPDKTGNWTVQARQAGHGAMIHIPLIDQIGQTAGPGLSAQSVAAGPDNQQRILMALAVIWGFVGTALYFSRKRTASKSI